LKNKKNASLIPASFASQFAGASDIAKCFRCYCYSCFKT